MSKRIELDANDRKKHIEASKKQNLLSGSINSINLLGGFNPAFSDQMEQQRIDDKVEQQQRLAESMRLIQQQQESHDKRQTDNYLNALRIIESEKKQLTTDSSETKTTTAPPVQQDVKPKEKTSIYQLRDDDFLAWVESENVLLDNMTMTKAQIHESLKKRNGHIWSHGFDDWNRQQPFFKLTSGRKHNVHRKAKTL